MLWWTEDLATGVEVIDNQHKTLFEKVNHCLLSADSQNVDKVKETLDYLTDYVIYHFGEEEKLMIRTGYEQFENHRDKHSYFIKQVFNINQQVKDQGINEEITHTMQLMMVEWLVDHIDNDDKTFAGTMKK